MCHMKRTKPMPVTVRNPYYDSPSEQAEWHDLAMRIHTYMAKVAKSQVFQPETLGKSSMCRQGSRIPTGR